MILSSLFRPLVTLVIGLVFGALLSRCGGTGRRGWADPRPAPSPYPPAGTVESQEPPMP